MTNTISDGTSSVVPLVIDGWASTNRSRSVVHTIINRDEDDVSLVAASLRTGTFRAVFDNEPDAELCRTMHTAPRTFMLTSDEAVAANMTYVLDGDAGVEQDEERDYWIVSISYREVGS